MSVYTLASLFTTQTNRCIFITGKAGTGKTTFLHRLREETCKQMAVVAPTGVAAINAGGVTIHSFFQLPFTPFVPTLMGQNTLLSKQKMNSARRKVLRELELLVIDEISMVRADVLDAIDTVLRGVRRRPTEPFGGVQMVFIGDMYQLSPVAQADEWRILSDYYKGIYFFHSRVMEQIPPVYIEFDKIFRQSDNHFIDVLNQVRNDCLTDEGMALLQTRYNPSFRPQKDDMHITLTTHNFKADAINSEELAKLKSKTKYFKATVKGDFPEKSYPAEDMLELKKGARVMFIKNDSETPRRFYNGKIGTITKFDETEDMIFVKPAEGNEDTIAVSPVDWENIRYSTNPETMQVEEEVAGKFTQYPLRLAWAITIHKSQGLTFDKAIIDAGASFAPGQVYVALSRCRSLEGMTLLSPINRYAIRNDDQIVRFSSTPPTVETLSEQLETSRLTYQNDLLLSVFDFSPIEISAKRWHGETSENESSFSEETLAFIRNIIEQLVNMESVAEKFRRQLQQIVSQTPPDKTHLATRLKASSEYFIQKLDILLATLRESPATTDSRENARNYDDRISEIFTAAAQKQHIIGGIADGFDSDRYFALRHSFKLPEFSVSAYSRSSTGQKLKSKHPELLSELVCLRNHLADDLSLPVYIIANTRTLVEMADYLPQNEREMLRISGMGKTRFERFGTQFLEPINRYCEMHDVKPLAFELPDKKRERKEKKPKGASAKESLALWREGLSIAEIAVRRGFVEGTIAQHLSRFIVSGELDIHGFVSPEQLAQAQEMLASKPEELSTFVALSSKFSQSEITIITGWLRKDKK